MKAGCAFFCHFYGIVKAARELFATKQESKNKTLKFLNLKIQVVIMDERFTADIDTDIQCRLNINVSSEKLFLYRQFPFETS